MNPKDLMIAQVTGQGSIAQPVLQFANLHVIRRAAEHGGGVLLSIQWRGEQIQFVLDDAGRECLITALSEPGEPITLPSPVGYASRTSTADPDFPPTFIRSAHERTLRNFRDGLSGDAGRPDPAPVRRGRPLVCGD